MFRPKVILQTGLFILIGSFLCSAQSGAQSRELANPPQKRFEISFGGGWGLYRMTRFNNRMDEVAGYVELIGGHVDIDHIDNGSTIFGEVGYFVSPKVSVNLGVTYLRGAGSYKENFIWTVDGYGDNSAVDTSLEEGSLTTTLVAPELKVKYHFPFEKTDLFLSGGVAWCFGKYVPKSTSGNLHLTAQGLGFLASTGAWYNLNETISLGAEIGYRHFVTGDLKDKDKDGERKVGTMGSFTGYKTNLDFSGPFILGSLSIGL
jgi:long-subunit fatty acid transport protein